MEKFSAEEAEIFDRLVAGLFVKLDQATFNTTLPKFCRSKSSR